MIKINGMTFSGNSVVVSGNKIIIDGKDATPDSKIITISVVGDLELLDVDCCDSISIKGNVGRCKSTNGNVDIEGAVTGDIETTNGNVRCGAVSGSVKTKNGNIKHS